MYIIIGVGTSRLNDDYVACDLSNSSAVSRKGRKKRNNTKTEITERSLYVI